MRSFLAALRSLILPYGATSGPRLVLDGVNGQITAYGTTDAKTIKINPNSSTGGDPGVEFTTANSPVGDHAAIEAINNGTPAGTGVEMRTTSYTNNFGNASRAYIRDGTDFAAMGNLETASGLFRGGLVETRNRPGVTDAFLGYISGTTLNTYVQADSTGLYLAADAGQFVNLVSELLSPAGRRTPFGIMTVPNTGVGAGTATVGTTILQDSLVATYTFTPALNRRYRVVFAGLVSNGNTVGDGFDVTIRMAAAVTGTSPVIAQTSDSIYAAGTPGRHSVHCEFTFTSATTATQQVAVFYQRTSGTGVFTPLGTRQIYVEDIGDAA